jgi:hypothetical protein
MRAPAVSMSPRGSRAPGEVLLHPLAIAALGLLLLNDHVLKALAPGAVTGKLSDFAGLAFFPLLLVAGWELARSAAGRSGAPSLRTLVVAIAVTAVWFGLIKTVAPVAVATGWALGAAQWLVGLVANLTTAGAIPPLRPTTIVVDPTDLIALLALAIPIRIGLGRIAPTRVGGGVEAAAPAP